jgi:hypothetical protein
MTTPALILSLMVLLVPPGHQKHNAEPAEAAKARYEVIATAIAAEAGEDVRLARFLLTVARHESTFRRDVHSGKVRGDGGRSWSLFQIMVSREPTQRLRGLRYRARDIVGTSPAATRRAADAAAHYLRPIIARCQGAARCVFLAYGGVSQTMGKRSEVKRRIDARVATYERLRAAR